MTELERAVKWLEYLLQVKEANVRAYPHRAQDVGAVHHCRVLLDALRWIPCAEKMPTEDDADENENVLCYWDDKSKETYKYWLIQDWNDNHKEQITHWMRLPKKPEAPKEE